MPRLRHSPARDAKLLEVWGSALAGASLGNGSTDRDFFSKAGGGAAGAEVGVRFLFLSAYIDYLRFFGGDTGANLLGLNLGGDGTIGITDSLAVVYRVAGAFYVGSVTDDALDAVMKTRGFGARGGLGIRYTFLKVFSVGVTPQFGYHYFFGGSDENAVDVENNSSGWDLQAMGYFRVGLGI